MAIIITTTGPMTSLPTPLQPKNKNFSDMIAVIQDEIDDTTNEYFSQIQEAIYSAIRFSAREPLYFNETRDITFLTTKNQDWYGATTEKAIASAAGIRFVFLEKSDGNAKRLHLNSPQELESAGSAHGEPYAYCYFGKKLRLFPCPDKVYKIRLMIEPYRLEEVLKADEESPWFLDAFDLVKARAKYELYKDILKDADSARTAFNDFNEQLSALKVETSRRNGSGKIKATVF